MPMFYSKRVFKTDIVNEYICILFSDNEAWKDVKEGSSPVKSQQGAYPYEWYEATEPLQEKDEGCSWGGLGKQ